MKETKGIILLHLRTGSELILNAFCTGFERIFLGRPKNF